MWNIKVCMMVLLLLNIVITKRTYSTTDQIMETITTNIPFLNDLNNSYKEIHNPSKSDNIHNDMNIDEDNDDYFTILPTVDKIKMKKRMIKNNHDSIQMFLINVEKALEEYLLNESFDEQQEKTILNEKKEFYTNVTTSTSTLSSSDNKKTFDDNYVNNVTDSYIEYLTIENETKDFLSFTINDENIPKNNSSIIKTTTTTAPINLKKYTGSILPTAKTYQPKQRKFTKKPTMATYLTTKPIPIKTTKKFTTTSTEKTKHDEITTVNYNDFTNYDQINYTIENIQEYDFLDIDEFLNSTLILNFIKMHPIQLWRTHGDFTIDYLKIINPHWLKYPPANEIVHYILAFLYCIIFFVGTSGNFLVIFMFIR